MIVLPAMMAAQAESWHALLDLHQRLPQHWVLVGGQMVHLFCAENGHHPERPTHDADAVVDVRADPLMLSAFTGALTDLGFVPHTSGFGLQHRWTHGRAQVDVLLPDGVGEVASAKEGAGGGRTLQAPGGTQALARAETVDVEVEGRQGAIRRPSLAGALVMKAAAHTVPNDATRGRHRRDFVTLAFQVAARDFRAADLRPKDRQRLRAMIHAVRGDREVLATMGGGEAAISRLERAAGLN